MLIVGGIPVEVFKKDVKNLRLCVKPPDGNVSVTAPLSMPLYEIEKFVHSKTSWIKQHVEKYKSKNLGSKQKYVSGEYFFVWGEQYNLDVKRGSKNLIFLSGEEAILTLRSGFTAEKREKFVREWYRKQLKEEIERMLPKLEKKTGLKVESINTKYMKTRWGSCMPKQKKICLNVQLAKYFKQGLEYVILHELIHFMERSHNARFKSLLDTYMPDWREIKKALNKQGLD